MKKFQVMTTGGHVIQVEAQRFAVEQDGCIHFYNALNAEVDCFVTRNVIRVRKI